MSAIKRICSVALCACLVAALYIIGISAETEPLRYGADGTFRILVFADTHQAADAQPKMIAFMGEALDYARPDLVVFNGDIVVGSACENEASERKAIQELLAPVTRRGLKFALVFGNHDQEYLPGGKDGRAHIMTMYQGLPGCLAYAGDPEKPGQSSFHLPIYSGKTSNELVSNLWFFDTGAYSEDPDRHWEGVRKDQIEWYESASRKLRRENGGNPVPSLAFQHMIVPEIYEYFPKVSAALPVVTRNILGVNRLILPDFTKIDGTVLGVPNPPRKTDGQFDSWAARGDIFAAVFGHDHNNRFTARREGIDLVNLPAATSGNFVVNELRGAALITLREDAPRSYELENVTYRRMAALPGSQIGNPDRLADSWISPLYFLEKAAVRTILRVRSAHALIPRHFQIALHNREQ